jgi:hypothetical protein
MEFLGASLQNFSKNGNEDCHQEISCFLAPLSELSLFEHKFSVGGRGGGGGDGVDIFGVCSRKHEH